VNMFYGEAMDWRFKSEIQSVIRCIPDPLFLVLMQWLSWYQLVFLVLTIDRLELPLFDSIKQELMSIIIQLQSILQPSIM
jgi:hypothetical protein